MDEGRLLLILPTLFLRRSHEPKAVVGLCQSGPVLGRVRTNLDKRVKEHVGGAGAVDLLFECQPASASLGT